MTRETATSDGTRRKVWTALAAALLLTLACGSATPIPSGAQAVHVSATTDELRLEPSVVAPGDAYIVLSESAYGLRFVHRSADPSALQSPPLPVTDDDIASVKHQGSFMGGFNEGLSHPPHGNVSRIGPLVEGKYLFLIDENEESPWSAELLKLAVLEVRN